MTKPFRVLSLDGGGMRGLHGAAYLVSLARKAAATDGRDVDLGKGFDLIVGTSTGSILGAALLMGIPMAKVAELYRSYGPKIFPLPLNTDLGSLALQPLRHRYLKRGDTALKEGLRATLGGTTLAEAYQRRGIAYGAAVVDIAAEQAQMLWTPHRQVHGQVVPDYTLVDVCLASTAAPMIRSMAVMPPSGRLFGDGGLWANNPVLVGLTEALTMTADNPSRPIEIFCLGLAPVPPELPRSEPPNPHWGAWQWRFGARAMCLSLATQATGGDAVARQLAEHYTTLGRPVTVVRCPMGAHHPDLFHHLDVDDVRPKTMDVLVQQAENDVAALADHPLEPIFNALIQDFPRL